DQALSQQWLTFDEQFKERQQALIKQRESGYAVRDLDRASEFISAVDAEAANKQPFAKAVQSQCLVYDSDGLSVNGYQWEMYVAALSDHVSQTAERSSDGSERDQLSMTLAGLTETTDGAAYS